MTALRPDANPGTFDIVSVDNGIDDATSDGTVEAVRAHSSCRAKHYADGVRVDSGHPVHRRYRD